MDANIQEFLNHLAAEKGSSDNTIAAYRNDLNQFNEYVTKEGGLPEGEWDELSRDHLINYILWLKEREYASATVARKVAAMKSFCGFLVRSGAVEDNPAEELDSPKVKKQLPTTLDARRGGEAPGPARAGQRLAQGVARYGPARSALRDRHARERGGRLTIDDVDLGAGTVRCVGKGNKERVMPLYAEACRAVSEYLEKGRPALCGHHPDERTLFLNPRGEKLTRQGLWLIIKAYARQLDLEDRVTPHTLRHSFATHMLNGGAGPARGAEAARPCEHLHHPGLHPHHPRTVARGLRRRAS